MENLQDWISAKDTLAVLTANGQNPANAESMIANYLRNGQLRAWADAIWKSDERFTSKAWKSCPADAPGGFIPTNHWRHEKALLEDRSQWRFVANRFLATTTLKPRRRIMMRGVKFNLQDLRNLQPTLFGAAVKRKRGKPVEIEKRDAAWLALLDAMHDPLHPLGAVSTKTELASAIDAAKERRGTEFGEKTRDDVASQAFDRLRSYHAL